MARKRKAKDMRKKNRFYTSRPDPLPVSYLLLGVAFATVLFLAEAWLFQLVWNWIVPLAVEGGPEIGYWTSLAIVTVFSVVFFRRPRR